MKIIQITENKRQYLPLLLLADEQENMIDCYLDRGTMYAIFDDDLRAVCVVTDEGEGILELKNLAVSPAHQKKGYGRELLDFAEGKVREEYSEIVIDASLPAKSIYLKRGYKEISYNKILTDNGDYLCYDVMVKK